MARPIPNKKDTIYLVLINAPVSDYFYIEKREIEKWKKKAIKENLVMTIFAIRVNQALFRSIPLPKRTCTF